MFEIKGMQKGSIMAISANNLGSCALGGFKEGSTATHGCRHCRATPQEIATVVCLNVQKSRLRIVMRNFSSYIVQRRQLGAEVFTRAC